MASVLPLLPTSVKQATMNSAESLYQSCVLDIPPTDGDVINDFGFNRVTSPIDRACLFGLYKGLVFGGLTPEDIHKLRVGSSLVPDIINVLYELPKECRTKDFPWLLNQAYTLERLSLQEIKIPSTQKGTGGNTSFVYWASACFFLLCVFLYAFGSNDHDLPMKQE